MLPKKNRKYVSQLAQWAREPENREHLNVINGLLQTELTAWMTEIAKRYYIRGLRKKQGVDRTEFAHLCTTKLLGYMDEHPDSMQDNLLTDKDLEYFLRRLARNMATDLLRKKENIYFDLMDDFSSLEGKLRHSYTRLSADLDPIHIILNAWPALHYELVNLPKIMHDFLESLRLKRKSIRIRNVAAALLTYCRSEGERNHIFCYWLLAWILFRGGRLYKDLKVWLRTRFPNHKYSAIISQITQLRKKFKTYLRENDLHDWVHWLTSDFTHSEEPPPISVLA